MCKIDSKCKAKTSTGYKILMYDILDKFEITHNKKYKCIRFLCDIQNKFINGYNKSFYYEYVFLNLYNILFNT